MLPVQEERLKMTQHGRNNVRIAENELRFMKITSQIAFLVTFQ